MKHKTLLLVAVTLLIAGCAGNQKPQAQSRDLYARHELPPVPPVKNVPLDTQLREAARQEILKSANSSDPIVHAHGIEAAQMVLPSDAPYLILKGLVDPSPVVRFSAAMATGELQLQQAKDRLLTMPNDPDRNVQVAVRFALHRLGDYRLSHDLERTSHDKDDSVRANTAVALGLIGEKSAVNVLKTMEGDPNASIRLQVGEAMWRLGSEDGLNRLIQASVSGWADDQIIAFQALAETGDQRVIGHIQTGLTSEYLEVRLAAAIGLGKLGSDQGYGIAMEGARSNDPDLPTRIRQQSLAALALGAIGRRDGQPALANLLKSPQPEVRLAAATGILEIK
jgi:HEAT repeat protein